MSRNARLVFRFLDGQPQELSLDAHSETTIGRHPQCTLTISQASVSRRHAKIWWSDGSWHVEDNKSSNKTFVNGQPIMRAAIKDGDEIRFGEFPVKLDVIPEVQPAQPLSSGTVKDLAAAAEEAMTHEDALREIRRCAGRQFDPRVVDAFVKIFRA